jgi:hypothetical protein
MILFKELNQCGDSDAQAHLKGVGALIGGYFSFSSTISSLAIFNGSYGIIF